MSPSDDVVRLRDLLDRVGSRIGLEHPAATGVLWARWAEIVGAAVASNAEPTSLRGGILRVRAVSPTWATELTYLTAEIRARANEVAGTDLVREVRIWTGPGPVARPTPRSADTSLDHGMSAPSTPSNVPTEDPTGALMATLARARAAWARRRSPGR